MIETLEKIFGSAAKVKIMRLFLFNPTETFDVGQIARRAKVTSTACRHEVIIMEKIGLIKKRSFFKDMVLGKGKKIRSERRRISGWTIDENFEYINPLRGMLLHVSHLRNSDVLKKLSNVGKLKLIIVSGVFINDWDSRVDLLIVGDGLRKIKIENVVKTIESELGRELRYTFFETADFQYRLGIYDKLIRDILDYPHEKILDKLNVAPAK